MLELAWPVAFLLLPLPWILSKWLYKRQNDCSLISVKVPFFDALQKMMDHTLYHSK